MGIGDIFGFGKKEKQPFRAPKEVAALRLKIDAETRENFPHSDRYDEIVKEARVVFGMLDATIKEREYAEEAVRVREDIRSRITRLGDKIEKNRKEAKREGKEDYVERNIDYLQRKSIRNSAKTLFADFLDQIEWMQRFCRGEQARGRTIDSTTLELINTILLMNTNFFSQHESDKEIRGLKNEVLIRLADIERLFNDNRLLLRAKGLEEQAAAEISKLLKVANQLSPG